MLWNISERHLYSISMLFTWWPWYEGYPKRPSSFRHSSTNWTLPKGHNRTNPNLLYMRRLPKTPIRKIWKTVNITKALGEFKTYSCLKQRSPSVLWFKVNSIEGRTSYAVWNRISYKQLVIKDHKNEWNHLIRNLQSQCDRDVLD